MSRAAPETLTVHVPFTLRQRGGRKVMETPDEVPFAKQRVDNTMVKALARAFRWKRMLESGEFATIGDLAAHEKIAPTYMTRVMRLTLLSPTIIERILAGRDEKIGLAVLLEPLPEEWEAQALTFLQKQRETAETTRPKLQ